MAIFNINNVSINTISACVPKKVSYVRDYDWITEKERDQVTTTTGIESRRFAPEALCTSDMAVDLCKYLYEKTGIDPNEIDILIFISQSRDYILPSTACILQDRLHLRKDCLAFDIPLGCSGYVYGLSVIAGLLSSAGGTLRRGLLIAGDVSSDNLNYRDKSTYPLFGDAVSATVVSFDPNATTPLRFNLQTDGSGYDALIIPDCGNRNSFSDETLAEKEYAPGIWRSRRNLWLDGPRIFEFTIREVALNVKNLLKASAMDISQISFFVLHQANKLMNETVRKQMKAPAEKVPYSIREYGNTSSASIPLTIVTQMQSPKENELWLLSGFGVGLSWGSVILNGQNIALPPLLEIDYEK